MHTRDTTRSGSILIITIVFMGVFMVLFVSLINYLLTQYRWVDIKTAEEQSFHIAEAGVEYYRWRLSHFPEDITDGTGGPGPYQHVYEDPETGPVGVFSLEVGGEVLCGKVQVVQATSTGWTYAHPEIKRTIVVRIARPTVADYSYIVDSNVWAGSSRTIIGPYHSNGVVRMDADNQSAVTSKVDTAYCGPTGLGGCGSYWDVIYGVYGSGTHPEWWRWGQPEIPFSNFDYDFGEMESIANSQGIFLSKISDDISTFGYYLVIDGTNVHIYKVDGVWKWVTSYAGNGSYNTFPELAGNMNSYRTLIETRAIPQDCPLIYVEDRTWVEGTVSGKLTVVANDSGAGSPDMFIQDDITYATGGGTDGFTALAENNLMLPLYIPNTMNINGIFFAQKGKYGRNYYECWWGPCTSTNPYDSYKWRNTLNTSGTVVSKLRTGTAWSDGQGFSVRNDYYDRNLANSPPPLTPFTSPNFRYIEWREAE